MIAITGSHGFVGKRLMDFASLEHIPFQAIARENYLRVQAYEGCEVVIHLAGLAHRKSATLVDFMQINCELALNCARTATQAGVKRFIYVSSSKALRNFAENAQPLKESEVAAPGCDYGHSKLAAEKALLELHREGVFEVVIVRPALVIGSPAKANLKTLAHVARLTTRFPVSLRLARWVFCSFELPKSYTSLENLCSALVCIARSRAGTEGIFHVVEDQAISTSALFNRLVDAGMALSHNIQPTSPSYDHRHSRLLQSLLKHALTFIGFQNVFQALANPLVLDGTRIQIELNWKPQAHIDAELQRIMANLPSLDERSKG